MNMNAPSVILRSGLFLVHLILLPGISRLSAQEAWSPLEASGSPRFSHHDSTYDGKNQRMVICGRSDGNPGKVETWFYLPDGSWQPGPAAASAFSSPFGNDVEVAFDEGRGVVVMFTSDGIRTETWELNGLAWSLKSPTHGPIAAIDGALMKFFPPEGKVMLVGAAGFPQRDSPSETWFWDGQDWSRSAAGEPVGAAGGGMAYDRERGEMVLVSMMSMNTWRFRQGAWVRASPGTVPSPGVWVFGMVYDSSTAKTVLFGGEGLTGGQPPEAVYPTDTWIWDGDNWSRSTVANAPPATIDFAMSCFPELGGLVMHGGWGEADGWQPRDSLWKLTLDSGPPPAVENLRLRIEGAQIVLSWNPVAGAQRYFVRSTADPAKGFTDDLTGNFLGSTWRTAVAGRKQAFFSVGYE
ncbi:MAG: hypothetical protein KDN22_27110 [Verrucomicrobiae bacterium]|nr:hypothetical protein [Verrucomicrobiae bacterium]